MGLYSGIMVTGCGGDIGFGIGRILKETKISNKIIGCDIHDDHPGKTVFDQCYIVEKADSSLYIESILDIVDRENIEVIIPTSEIEIRYLVKNNFFGRSDLFLTANQQALEIGFDKYKTVKALEEKGLLFPWTRLANGLEPLEIPCVSKSRMGCGSKNVVIVTEENIEFVKKCYNNDLWQEYLKPDDEEYTCGLYRSNEKEIRTMIMKRKLVGDSTGSGSVCNNEKIEKLLENIAELTDLCGSINVQLRLTERGPIVFEINPRFSSTVMFRHKMGFKDLIWSLEEHSGRRCSKYIKPQYGVRFYRTCNEVII